MPLGGWEQGEGPEVEILRVVELPQALQDVRGVECPPRGRPADGQGPFLRVQRTIVERVVDALGEVGVVVAHDPSLPRMLQERVPDEETGPCRLSSSFPSLGAGGHVGD